ncbi:sensor histidine kinase [Flavobacterium sp. N1719]|uniref:ATP-binding protein n=1 Tax=Flavobacterium sp. N1719 TaxID=2885633 RepID=UPI002222CC0E|nr:sensor histidine kinase [Flavobacterium sp. N1719]
MRYLFSLLVLLSFVSCEEKDSYSELFGIINSNEKSINNVKQIKSLIIKIDSVKQDSSRISLLNSLLTKTNKFDYKHISFEIIEKIDKSSVDRYDKIYAKYLINKALYFRKTENLDSSFFYYNEAKKKNENIKNIKFLISSLYGMAELESKFNNYVTSEIKLKRVINLSTINNNYKYYYISCIALGNNYMSKGDYYLSLYYHKKAHEYYLKNKEKLDFNFLHREVFLNNIGNVYKHLAKYEVAIDLFNKALRKKSVIIQKDYELYGILISNLGHCYLNLKNYNQAIKHFRIAETVFRKLKNYEELSLVLIQQSELYTKLKNKKVSDYKGVNALKYSRLAKALKCELFILEKLIQLEYNTKANTINYINLRNKIDKIEDKSRNIFYKIQLETNQIAQAKEKAENQRNQVVWAIGILLFVSAFLFIIYRNRLMNNKMEFQQKHQKSNERIHELILQNQALEVEVRQKEQRRIAMEIHDGVLNQLASIRFKLFKLELNQEAQTIKEALQNVNSIQNIEVELRNLTHDLHAQSSNERVLLIPIIQQLIQVHQEIYNIQIELQKDNWDWEQLSAEIKMGFTRIIQEALHNVVKHAKATQVLIQLQYESNNIILRIKDNGKGLDFSSSISGIGLANIHLRAEQIQSKVKITSKRNQGTEIQINTPVFS